MQSAVSGVNELSIRPSASESEEGTVDMGAGTVPAKRDSGSPSLKWGAPHDPRACSVTALPRAPPH